MVPILASTVKERFLNAFAEGMSLKDAAHISGIALAAHYNWLRTDQAYVAAFEFAKGVAADKMEDEAKRRAVAGYEEVTVFYETTDEGERVEKSRKVVSKYSDQLLQLLLRAHKPDMYSEKLKTEVTSNADIVDILNSARKRLQK